MFLDLIECKTIAVDEQPVGEGEDHRIRFHSSGKIEVYETGVWRDVRAEEIRWWLNQTRKFYGI